MVTNYGKHHDASPAPSAWIALPRRTTEVEEESTPTSPWVPHRPFRISKSCALGGHVETDDHATVPWVFVQLLHL